MHPYKVNNIIYHGFQSVYKSKATTYTTKEKQVSTTRLTRISSLAWANNQSAIFGW
jgi:hypothetical protein